MATTTNFGWETPDDTDLVKDGAAAMRTLGNSIDTSFVDLKGGTTGQILSKNSNTDLDYLWITNDVGDITAVTAGTGISGGGTSGAITITNSMATTIDAKGDLIAGTGADAFSRLAVGTNGTVLTADSSEATGLKWATPSAAVANFSLLNAGGTALTGATSITVSGISNIQTLQIIVDSASSANASSFIRFQLNGDTGANYTSTGFIDTWESSYANTNYAGNTLVGSTIIRLARMSTAAGSSVNGGMTILGCNSSGAKSFWVSGAASAATGSGHTTEGYFGVYTGSSTISSITIISSTGNFDSGTIYVYGSAV